MQISGSLPLFMFPLYSNLPYKLQLSWPPQTLIQISSTQLDCQVLFCYPSLCYWEDVYSPKARTHLVYSSQTSDSCSTCCPTDNSHFTYFSRVLAGFGGMLSLLPITLSLPLEVSGYSQRCTRHNGIHTQLCPCVLNLLQILPNLLMAVEVARGWQGDASECSSPAVS